jgi:hypothetical protein
MKPLNLSHISNAKDSGNISEDSPRTPPPPPIQLSISPGRSSRNRNRPFMINSSNSSDDNQADYSGFSSAKSMADRESSMSSKSNFLSSKSEPLARNEIDSSAQNTVESSSKRKLQRVAISSKFKSDKAR